MTNEMVSKEIKISSKGFNSSGFQLLNEKISSNIDVKTSKHSTMTHQPKLQTEFEKYNLIAKQNFTEEVNELDQFNEEFERLESFGRQSIDRRTSSRGTKKYQQETKSYKMKKKNSNSKNKNNIKINQLARNPKNQSLKNIKSKKRAKSSQHYSTQKYITKEKENNNQFFNNSISVNQFLNNGSEEQIHNKQIQPNIQNWEMFKQHKKENIFCKLILNN